MGHIAVKPQMLRFKAADEEAFMSHVQEADGHTTMIPIEEPADVMLGDDGAIKKDGYRLSTLALQQLCQCVAGGLSVLVDDISGTRRRATAYDSVVSVGTATRILNTCVDLRFRMEKGPYGRIMIRDTKNKIVEGIVGPGYRYLAHCHLYEGVRDMLSQLHPPASFGTAQLYGRRLALCMMTEDPLFTSLDGDDFYAGYYFANSEAGECSVVASSLLGLAGGDARCIGGFTGMQKISHSGRSFHKKLTHLLAGALVDPRQAATLGDCVKALLNREVDVLNEEKEYDEQKFDVLVARFQQQGLTAPVARDVLRWALRAGVRRRRKTPGVCTSYDAFMAMMHRAAKMNPDVREPVEQVAYKMLLGRFKL